MSNVIQLHKLGYCERCRRPIKRGEFVTRMIVGSIEDPSVKVELKTHQGMCPSHRLPDPDPGSPPALSATG